MNADDDEHEKIMEFFGIQKEQVPSMRLIRLEDEMTKFKPETNDFNEQSIKDFVAGVLDGKIKVNFVMMFSLIITNDFYFIFIATFTFTRITRRLG